MDNKIVLESLASDLKRIALGLHRGSYRMAERFSKEALERANEVNRKNIPQYLRNVLDALRPAFTNPDSIRKAEDMLMYSTLVQNYVSHKQV